MNIGILTHHWVYNFGANLQTLSTVGFIERSGHTPFVINWIPQDSEIDYSHSTLPSQVSCFKEFQKQYMPLTALCRTTEDIAAIIRKCNIERVIIGSDTVFKLRKEHFSIKKFKNISPRFNNTFPNPFWGDFLNWDISPSIRAYSAATFDTNPHQFDSKKNEIKAALLKFEKISVRDNATQNFISYFTDQKIIPEITPDPVFGFNNNITKIITKEEITRKFNLPENYVLACFTEYYRTKINSWVQKLADKLQKGYNLPLYELPRQTGEQLLNIKQITPNNITPLEWYYIIKYSKGYIGQLMHPIIVAMHNVVPFYCMDYYGLRRFKGFNIDYTTSKVYQIVKSADMLDRYCHIGEYFSTLPDIDIVLDKLFQGDLEKRLAWSRNKQEESFNSMKRIIL